MDLNTWKLLRNELFGLTNESVNGFILRHLRDHMRNHRTRGSSFGSNEQVVLGSNKKGQTTEKGTIWPSFREQHS